MWKRSYVGNRGVWEPGGPLGYPQPDLCRHSTQHMACILTLEPVRPGITFRFAGNPCVPGNDCDRALLASRSTTRP